MFLPAASLHSQDAEPWREGIGLYRNILFVDEQQSVRVKVTTKQIKESGNPKQWQLFIRDFFHNEVMSLTSAQTSMSVDDNNMWVTIIIPRVHALPSGWYNCELIVKTANPDITNTADFCVVPRRFQINPADAYFAIGLVPMSVPKHRQPFIREPVAIMLEKLGVHACKAFYYWKDVQAAADTPIDFSEGDRASTILTGHSILLMPTLEDYPQWSWAWKKGELRPGQIPESDWAKKKFTIGMPQPDEASYRAFVAKMVTRYKGKIPYWEIGNEVNSVHHGCSETEYANLLRWAYETIKKIDPKALVVSSGLTGAKESWIKTVFDAGGGPFCDVIAFHPYRYPDAIPEKANTERAEGYGLRSFIDDCRAFKDLADKMPPRTISGKKPLVWITEVGYSTWGLKGMALHTSVTPEIQAAYMVRMLLLGQACGIDKFFWWRIESTSGGGMGILGSVEDECQPKPAFAAFATASRLTEGFTSSELEVLCDQTVYVCRIKRGKDTIYALWAIAPGKTAIIKNTVSITGITITGSKFTVEPKQGECRIGLSDFPVFLINPQPLIFQ